MHQSSQADGTLPDHPGPSEAWDGEEDGITTLHLHLVEPLDWRDHPEREDRVELWAPRLGRWKRVPRAWLHIFHGLQDGEDLPTIQARLRELRPEREAGRIRYWLRTTVRLLKTWGLLEVVLPPMPDVLGGRYRVVDEVGRGGMGVVWLCQDLEAGGDGLVAVKHAWNWAGSFEGRERELAREAEVLAAVDTPSVASFLGTFEHDGRLHVVREYVEGPNLVRHVKDDPPDVETRLGFTRTIAQGLAELAGAGYVCMDIKPDNYILAEPTGELKLVDLGLCRRLPEEGYLEFPGGAGTQGYVAPEARAEDVASELTAVYAVGRVHMTLVRGKLPRESYTLEELLDKLEAAGATRDEMELMATCCAVDPTERPQRLADVVALIDDILGA